MKDYLANNHNTRNIHFLSDVIGICTGQGKLVTFKSRVDNEVTKSDLVIVDNSKTEVAMFIRSFLIHFLQFFICILLIKISLTVWGKDAANFPDVSQPVIFIEGARVGDFNGRNLSCTNSSFLMVTSKSASQLRASCSD